MANGATRSRGNGRSCQPSQAVPLKGRRSCQHSLLCVGVGLAGGREGSASANCHWPMTADGVGQAQLGSKRIEIGFCAPWDSTYIDNGSFCGRALCPAVAPASLGTLMASTGWCRDLGIDYRSIARYEAWFPKRDDERPGLRGRRKRSSGREWREQARFLAHGCMCGHRLTLKRLSVGQAKGLKHPPHPFCSPPPFIHLSTHSPTHSSIRLSTASGSRPSHRIPLHRITTANSSRGHSVT